MGDDTVIIIPARYASSRFPGKPLHPLRGPSGVSRPLIEWTWRTASRVPGIDAVYVATDSEEIAVAVEGFGGNVIKTSTNCRNGTERCAEAMTRLSKRPRLIVNVQGDAPLTPISAIAALIERAFEAKDTAVVTPALRCSLAQFERLETDARRGIVGATTVVQAEDGRALYFSKQLVPYLPQNMRHGTIPIRLHLGIYAYSPDSLEAYSAYPETLIERLEGLEQLRFLDMGARLDVVSVDPPAWDIWELNNPADVDVVEIGLSQMGKA